MPWFEPRELLACIHALMRRQRFLGFHRTGGLRSPVRFGPFTFDIAARRLTRDAKLVHLSSGELALLMTLAAHAGEPLSRERLIDLMKGPEADSTDRSVDVQVVRLRRVIEDDVSQPQYLRTVRGVGYVLVVDQPPA